MSYFRLNKNYFWTAKIRNQRTPTKFFSKGRALPNELLSLEQELFLDCENKESTHTNKIFFYLYSGLYCELVFTSTVGFLKPELNNFVQFPKTNDNSAKTDT